MEEKTITTMEEEVMEEKEIVMKDYKGKNDNDIKAQVRKDVIAVITKALISEYGEENVKQVGTSEYGAIVGTTLVDGSPNEIVVSLKPTIKEWKDRTTEKKVFMQYVLEDEAEIYRKSVAEKEEKAEAEKKAKEEKKARDEAKRKAEKEAKKKKLEERLEDTGEEEME